MTQPAAARHVTVEERRARLARRHRLAPTHRTDDVVAVTDEAEPWAALLPGLDPTTMGWKERSWYVRPEHVDLFFDSGNAGPTVWVDGRAVGMWVQRRDGEVATEVLEPLTREQRDAVDRAAASLRQVVGDTRFSVRFPSPLVRRLLA